MGDYATGGRARLLASAGTAEPLHPQGQLAELDVEPLGYTNESGESRVGNAPLELADSLKANFEAVGKLLMGHICLVSQLLDRFTERPMGAGARLASTSGRHVGSSLPVGEPTC